MGLVLSTSHLPPARFTSPSPTDDAAAVWWRPQSPWDRPPASHVDYTEAFRGITPALRRPGRFCALLRGSAAQREMDAALRTLDLDQHGARLDDSRVIALFQRGAPVVALEALGTLARLGVLNLTARLWVPSPGGQRNCLGQPRGMRQSAAQLLASQPCPEASQNAHAMPLMARFALLAQAGQDLDAVVGPRRGTLLHLAAQNGNEAAIRALVEAGARVDVLNRDDLSALVLAVRSGQVGAARALVEMGAIPDRVEGKAGRAAIHHAAICNQADALRAFGSLGANMNLPDDEGVRPIHLAAACNHVDSIEALHEAGCDLDAWVCPPRTPSSAMALAALGGNIDSLRTLARLGADIENPVPPLGRTALHFAAMGNKAASIAALAAAGCNLNASDDQGNTALHLAAYRDATHATGALIKAGAALNLPNRSGDRPVDMAGLNSNPGPFDALRRAGAEGPYHYIPRPIAGGGA